MSGRQTIDEVLNQYSEENIDFDVYILADAQHQTAKESDHRILHADESEFFSRREFAEIASALFNVFGFAKVFYSEIAFIEYFIRNKIDPRGCIVYNLSRDGVKQGKKSLIPAFCDLYNIRYTGSDAFVISLLRNKAVYSDFLAVHGIKVPQTVSFLPEDGNMEELLQSLQGQEVIIKNISESASIGLQPDCRMRLTPDKQQEFCEIARKVNSKHVLVQEFISGTECETLVLQYHGKYHALDPVEIRFSHGKEFMDSEISNAYDYTFGMLPEKMGTVVRQAAVRAAELLGVKDYARFDFRIKDGVPYLFDIAGTPYTIRHSSVAYLFKQYGLNYEDIYKVIVSCMLSNYRCTQS